MPSFEFNVAPEYKKSFVDYTTIEKRIDDKKIKVTREILWRFGEIQVTVTEDEFEKYVKDKDLEINKMENNEEGDFYDLEDYHNYTVVETKYEMHGDLDIYNINF